jgi:hypothetical protein
MIDAELIDESCLVSWYTPVAKLFVYDSPILSLSKPIISTGTCSVFGLRDIEPVEKMCKYGDIHTLIMEISSGYKENIRNLQDRIIPVFYLLL